MICTPSRLGIVDFELEVVEELEVKWRTVVKLDLDPDGWLGTSRKRFLPLNFRRTLG
jgi:hypothetical protein